MNFRLLLPKPQDARCSNCGRALRERRRRPCPTCGDTRRTIVRSVEMGSVAVIDRMG